MKILYINNFRGFKETFIPINRVNFLIGENSTGKTSILKLIKLLSDFHFRYSYEFYSPEVDLGRFEDIVSKDSKIKFFEIGFFAESDEQIQGLYGAPKTSQENRFTKFRFIEKDEKTTLSEISFKNDFVEVFIKLIGSTYQFVHKFNKVSDIDQSNIYDAVTNWMIKGAKIASRASFKSVDQEIVRGFELRWFLRLVADEINKKSPKAGHVEFEKRVKIERYLNDLFSLQESFFPEIKWIAPIRAEPKRIYEHLEAKSSADGSHAPQILKEILVSNTKTANKFKQFISDFGKSSHLFDEIKIRKFGSDKFAPFEIQVLLEGKPFSISNVGYGISQVLPLLLEIFDDKNSWLAIQQPEVHLHPKAQAEFGEVIYNSLKQTDKHFFIETHSDFTIDRFRYCTSKNGLSNDSGELTAQVLYFSRENSGNKIHIIPISEDGSYAENQTDSFREFFINESIKLIGI